MRHLRALVVDDSAVNRKLISEILESMPGVRVVGHAASGDEALQQVATLEPNLITLDLEMPRMDGFSFLRFVMARRSTPVIVVSSHSAKDNVFRALELGALDFVAKPTASMAEGEQLARIRDALVTKVELVRHLRKATLDDRKGLSSLTPSIPARRSAAERPAPANASPRELIITASSTGGPSALVELFATFPSDAPVAVLVVQHMPPRFTQTFAERLDRLGGLRVAEATHGEALRAGHARVCPGGRCVEIVRGKSGWVTRVVPPAPEDRYAPSADRAMISASEVVGPHVFGVVLTGMGEDAARGAVAVKKRGGRVMVQSPESAIIDGMPRAVMRAVDVDGTHPLVDLGRELGRQLWPQKW